jgi:hypothetical protein
MGQMAAAVRASVSVVAVVAAIVGAVPPVSFGRVVLTLAVFVGWSAVYVWWAWTRGLSGWMLAVDVALACWLCLDLGGLVPPDAQPRGTSWVTQVASMVVVCAQLNGRPALSIPGGFLVAAGFVAGSQRAGVPDGAVAFGFTIAIQALAAAGCMVVATRTGRATSSAFAGLQAAERAAGIRLAQHEDELSQLRIVHNGALTTLTMAAHGMSHPTALLRQRAAADLATLPRLTELSRTPRAGTGVRLDARLAQVVARYRSLLTIDVDLAPCEVPARIGQAFSEAVSEALENITRHAGTVDVEVTLSTNRGHVAVLIRDRGCGFDGTQTEYGFGLREAIIGRMRGIGGEAHVDSVPGRGTTVAVEWTRG